LIGLVENADETVRRIRAAALREIAVSILTGKAFSF
jgi:hypothetical protein